MNIKYNELDDYLKRRVEFLLAEAVNSSPKDQVITYCMRVLSNHATVGRDAGSYFVKINNKRVSRSAEELLKNSNSLCEWAGNCINEHEIPLKSIWGWMLLNANKIKPENVWDKICEARMVTITKVEDLRLNSLGLKNKDVNGGRYLHAGVKVVNLHFSPKELVA